MKLQADYNLEEMVAHLLKENKEFRVQYKYNGTQIIYKSLGQINPVLVNYWVYFDKDGKQVHKTAPVAAI